MLSGYRYLDTAFVVKVPELCKFSYVLTKSFMFQKEKHTKSFIQHFVKMTFLYIVYLILLPCSFMFGHISLHLSHSPDLLTQA